MRKGKLLGVESGRMYGRLTALRRLPNDKSGNQMWVFTCSCGKNQISSVSNVLYGLRTLEWASCKDCYRAQGGYEGRLRAMGLLPPECEGDNSAPARVPQ